MKSYQKLNKILLGKYLLILCFEIFNIDRIDPACHWPAADQSLESITIQ